MKNPETKQAIISFLIASEFDFSSAAFLLPKLIGVFAIKGVPQSAGSALYWPLIEAGVYPLFTFIAI